MRNNNFECCIDCKDRSVGCHSKCEKYLAAKAIYDEKKEQLKINAEQSAEWYQYEGEAKERVRRGHNKRT